MDGLPLTDRVTEIAALRKQFGDRTPALVETVLLRRRAADKLPGTGEWLFTDEALQQASAAAVASHRAQRLAGRIVHDVTCSIGTEVAALRGSARPGWWAAISTRCGWRWRDTTWVPRPTCAAPTRYTQ